MSIFKESFKDWVKRQLFIREEVINSNMRDQSDVAGNTGTDPEDRFKEFRTRPGRFGENFVEEEGPYGITREVRNDYSKVVDPGAFIAYQQKTCNIRMSSGANIKLPGAKRIALKTVDELRGEYVPEYDAEQLQQENLAKRWILEGGTISHEDTFGELDLGFDYETQEELGTVDTSKAHLKDNSLLPSGKRSGGLNMRGGFYNGAYGDPAIVSDPSGDGYGVVPMPGIEKVSVRTKTAYGSLREAKISFVCHNQRQLDALELLYMRPGIPILLEWGWSTYINNDGNIEKDGALPDPPEAFFHDGMENNTKLNMSHINDIIFQRKKVYHGNYDAILGMVKNYNYKARADGGYDCETEIIAQGEIIESLKGNQMLMTNHKNNVIQKDMLEKCLEVLSDWCDLEAKFYKENGDSYSFFEKVNIHAAEELDENWFSMMCIAAGTGITGGAIGGALSTSWTGPGMVVGAVAGAIIGFVVSLAVFAFDSLFGEEELYDLDRGRHCHQLFDLQEGAMQPPKDLVQEAIDNSEQCNLSPKDVVNLEGHNLMVGVQGRAFMDQQAETLRNLVIPAWGFYDRASEGEYVKGIENGEGAAYIRWDAFCYLLNTMAINKDSSGKPLIYFTCLQYEQEESQHRFRLAPLLFSQIPDNGVLTKVGIENDTDIMNCSINPAVCLMPKQLRTALNRMIGSDKFYDIWNGAVLCHGLGHDLEAHNRLLVASKNTNYQTITTARPGVLSNYETNQSIGNIGINVDYALAKYREMRYDADENLLEDFNLYDYVEALWESINAAVGNSNKFVLNINNDRPNEVRVIDLNFQKNPELDVKDVYELRIQSSDSIFRKFSYNSVIPSSLSSTIAIAVQNPGAPQDMDAATFSAFSQDIYSRFHSQDDKPEVEDRKEKQLEIYKKNVYDMMTYLRRILRHLDKVQEGQFSKVDPETGMPLNDKHAKKVGKASLALKQYKAICNLLTSQYHYNDEANDIIAGDQIKELSPSVSAMVPLKFNGVMDGIGGIIIGNLFRIDPSRLPTMYKAAKVGFIVMGEQQEITAGNDWTTSINGQLIILPEENTEIVDQANKTPAGTENMLAKYVNEYYESVGMEPKAKEKENLDAQDSGGSSDTQDPGNIPNATKLRSVMMDLGIEENGLELATNGDITEEFYYTCKKLFTVMRTSLPNTPIRVNSGNDKMHAGSNFSRHKHGRGLDFSIGPDVAADAVANLGLRNTNASVYYSGTYRDPVDNKRIPSHKLLPYRFVWLTAKQNTPGSGKENDQYYNGNKKVVYGVMHGNTRPHGRDALDKNGNYCIGDKNLKAGALNNPDFIDMDDIKADNGHYYKNGSGLPAWGEWSYKSGGTEKLQKVEEILKEFVIGNLNKNNKPMFAYGNEYLYPTAHATGGHFHISIEGDDNGNGDFAAGVKKVIKEKEGSAGIPVYDSEFGFIYPDQHKNNQTT